MNLANMVPDEPPASQEWPSLPEPWAQAPVDMPEWAIEIMRQHNALLAHAQECQRRVDDHTQKLRSIESWRQRQATHNLQAERRLDALEQGWEGWKQRLNSYSKRVDEQAEMYKMDCAAWLARIKKIEAALEGCDELEERLGENWSTCTLADKGLGERADSNARRIERTEFRLAVIEERLDEWKRDHREPKQVRDLSEEEEVRVDRADLMDGTYKPYQARPEVRDRMDAIEDDAEDELPPVLLMERGPEEVDE